MHLVGIETDARQMTLHGFDIGAAQLARSRPRRREWLRAQHAVAEVPDKQYVQIREIIFLDDEIIFRGQKCRAIDALGLQQRGRLRLLAGAELFAAYRHKARAQPFADRFCHLRHALGAVDAGWCADLISPAYAGLPALVDELLGCGAERIRHRMPDVLAAGPVEIAP